MRTQDVVITVYKNIFRRTLSQYWMVFILCGISPSVYARSIQQDTTPLSTPLQAIAFLDQQTHLSASQFWPKVLPVPFLQNLRNNVLHPLDIYEGRSTNFCAYAALSYLPLHDNPLAWVRFMVQLYTKGNAGYGREYFEPTKEVRKAAGTLRFKGELDIRPADQLWFLTLADHFKGYLNFFDKKYDIGDENTFWAAVNFAKFNRMVRRLFNYRVKAVGSDLIRPGIRTLFEYLTEKLKNGNVALFVNNPELYKKKHPWIRVGIPTHYIILLSVEEAEDKIAITYWDYGGKSRQIVTEKFLKKIIFGISQITRKQSDEN